MIVTSEVDFQVSSWMKSDGFSIEPVSGFHSVIETRWLRYLEFDHRPSGMRNARAR